ncbi:uncharacterized protein LOC131334393 isoform X2 [Rhododendron vialii]|uniref:uncharacterized protein LOC131334393 isoform X2 n=1 Tax=Rhododendron vialii TaxID=182163 RepID=UPI00265F9BEC|nr:uncharacterized protein LOC131334393 isoform X2 [Rhododendron vialii]
MDYDDNDFQGQNLHLAGEGSSKFSPVLHPYALPKFDFDDGLQSHLRFDSLVENEVFLGIPSQEDNQWIEDFSRGSSGIEFSPSAAESCSISRRNNVWSEATSSESVEMLLKSVRQEEMVPGDTIIEESDACRELGGLTEGMEHHLKQDDEAKDGMNLEPAGASAFLSSNFSCETHVIIGSEGVDRKCDDTTQAEVDNSLDDSHDIKLQKDSSGAGMQIGDIDSDSQDIAVASVQLLKTQEPEHQDREISIGNTSRLSLGIGKAVENQQVLSEDADADDQILKGIEVSPGCQNLEGIHSPSEATYIEEHRVESGISNIEETLSLPPKGESNSQIAEGCSKDLRSTDPEKASKCEPVDLSHDNIVAGGDSNIEEHAIEAITKEDGIPSSSELKIDQTRLQGSDNQLWSEASVSYSEASLMSGVDNKLFDGQGDGSSNYVGDLPSLQIACSSTELIGEKHAAENLEGMGDASAVHNKDLDAEDHALSHMAVGSVQTYKGNIVSSSNEVQSNQDVSVNERDDGELPKDSSTMDSAIVKSRRSVERVAQLSQVDDMKVNIELAHQSEWLVTAGDEPALNVVEQTNVALHDTVDGAPLLSGTVTTADKGSDLLDKNTKTGGGSPEDTNLLSFKDGSQGASDLCPVLEVEKSVSQSSTLETSNLDSWIEQSVKSGHKADVQSLPMVETCNKTSGSEQVVKANEISQTSSCQLEVCLNLGDSAVKEGSKAERLLSPGNCEKAAVQRNHEVAPSKVAGHSVDFVKPLSGMPTVSSFVLSQSEKEGVKESMGGTVSLTEITVQSTSHDVSGDNPAKDERVHLSASLSEREATKDGESVTAIQTCTKPMIVEGFPSTPAVVQMDPKMVSELSRGSSQAPDGETASGGSKSTPERKTRRAPGRSTRKENSRRGSHVKETTPGNVESSRTTPRAVVSIPTSNLPDLNTSAPPSVSFHQPFTDLQQVQLRAQIFVYGSLIQRAAPDEACMVSAFGASDGGRSVWEPVWRSYMERVQGQKSHPNKSETLVQPRSGARPTDQPIKRGARQSKAVPSPLGQASSKGTPSPLGQASSKGTPSPVSNPMIPLSSPLWNISTPGDVLQSSGLPRIPVLDYKQTLPPMHPFQTPPTRGFIGHNWLSQTHFPGPWVASPQTSTSDANARFSVSPMTETVKLNPVKESSVLVTSEAKYASPITLVHSSGPGVIAATSSLSDMKRTAVLPSPNSTGPKARKRKKVDAFEDLGQISLLAQTRTESVSAPIVASHFSTSVMVSTPNIFASKADAVKIVASVSPSSSTDHPKTTEQNVKQNVMSEDTLSKVAEAKQHAEDAATLAAAAVSHSLSVWSQLDKLKNSGLTPDVEGKLASAAVAVAAAASVAKAAAAAAEIASNAALQAKMMADEALAPGRTSNPAQGSASSLSAVNNFGNASPASILMGGNVSTSSSSILVAAREAARKRVEAASAASKQAENLDAILKAAELAAEAVSQAGKIVAMGDPLPLSELVKAGPDGYWRVPQQPPEQGVVSNNENRERSEVRIIENCPHVAKEAPSEPKIVNPHLAPPSGEVPRESIEDHVRAADGLSSSLKTRQTDSRAKRSRRALDLSKTIGVVPESEIESRTVSITAQDEYEKEGEVVEEETGIKDGCLVEVRKDGDGFKTAWFSANVLSLKDRKAFVRYTELQSDEGSGKLREWVALEGEANNAPRIRIAHHITALQFEGTRKRRRAAMGDYQWSVGDRVDVWMQDCWREGVLTEKNKKDESILTVHFPAEGETSVVKAWHLRPTLIWNDGEWIESRSKDKGPSTQGDTPQEKRLKLGIPAIENREKDKMSNNIEFGESEKPEESRLLPLSANEKVFNVGKNIEDQNKPGALRTLRTGLQKEGSRVVFGVPKPGKKRKFMEVSKHYVAERSSKTNESNDSVKFAKYLMPQGSGPRGWKNTKIISKEKQATESKTKVLKSGKSLSVFGRTLPQKDKVSAQNDGPAMDHMIKDSGITDENVSRKQRLVEFGAFSKPEGSAEGPALFSSLAPSSDAPSKKTSTSNTRSERGNGGKLAHSSGKLAKGEVDKLDYGNPGKSISETAEPRRSNRRIQPTSRLLEGLQSSLVIPKFPAVSHDKSHRNQSRGGTSSKGNNHG